MASVSCYQISDMRYLNRTYPIQKMEKASDKKWNIPNCIQKKMGNNFACELLSYQHIAAISLQQRLQNLSLDVST